MKAWRIVSFTPGRGRCRRADGRLASQIEMAVLAPSKKAAHGAISAYAKGWSYYAFNQYAGETGNQETIDALSEHPPLTVLMKPLHAGDTIDGTTGWRPAS